MKRAVLFLHGRYRAADFPQFKKWARNAYMVAVDGGYRFFSRTGLCPDLLIGDFDSLKHLPRQLSSETEVIRAEVRKDQTDAELALRHVLTAGYRSIDIVQPACGEPDHFLGNLMLLRLAAAADAAAASRPVVRLLSATDEIRLMRDEAVVIRQAAGCRVSVLALGPEVIYSCTGTEYRASRVTLRPGETRGLRNRITAARARFWIDGEALLVRQLARS